eukprot:1193148-Prorocentrum_minimum.AAC.1
MELRHNNFAQALGLMRRATAKPRGAKGKVDWDGPVQFQVSVCLLRCIGVFCAPAFVCSVASLRGTAFVSTAVSLRLPPPLHQGSAFVSSVVSLRQYAERGGK